MTSALQPRRVPFLGILIAILIALGLIWLSLTQVSVTPPSGGGNNNDDWKKNCLTWEAANSGLEASITSVLSWFAPSGALHGVDPNAVTNAHLEQAIGSSDFDDIFMARQDLNYTRQVRNEYGRGLCYPFANETLMSRLLNLFK